MLTAHVHSSLFHDCSRTSRARCVSSLLWWCCVGGDVHPFPRHGSSFLTFVVSSKDIFGYSVRQNVVRGSSRSSERGKVKPEIRTKQTILLDMGESQSSTRNRQTIAHNLVLGTAESPSIVPSKQNEALYSPDGGGMSMVMSSVDPQQLEPNIIRLRGDGLAPCPFRHRINQIFTQNLCSVFMPLRRFASALAISTGVETSDVRPESCRLYQAPREQI